MVGSGVSLGGGLITLGGILAAPFTGGATLAVALGTGAAVGIGGAATNFLGDRSFNEKLGDQGNKAN